MKVKLPGIREHMFDLKAGCIDEHMFSYVYRRARISEHMFVYVYRPVPQMNICSIVPDEKETRGSVEKKQKKFKKTIDNSDFICYNNYRN